MYSNDEIRTIISELQAAQSTPWYMETNIIMTILVCLSIVCAFVTMAIAHENERSKFLAFIAGFFLGTLGIAIYAIIGETIELRVALEEKARRQFTDKHSSIKI